jgi:formimidoylglutamate deiminase
MACMGYTAVAEFHYLHHQHNGKPFVNTSEMGQSLMRAAQRAGLHLTLIPILYQQGGIHQPPTEKQRRFIHEDIEDFYPNRIFKTGIINFRKSQYWHWCSLDSGG